MSRIDRYGRIVAEQRELAGSERLLCLPAAWRAVGFQVVEIAPDLQTADGGGHACCADGQRVQNICD